MSLAKLWEEILALSALAAPAAAQTLGQGGDTDIPWLRLASALLLCLGLAAGAALALNRRMGGAPLALGPLDFGKRLTGMTGGRAPRPGRLSDIETRRLSPQVTVSVFRCDGRSFMAAVSAQGELVLVSLDEPPPDADA